MNITSAASERGLFFICSQGIDHAFVDVSGMVLYDEEGPSMNIQLDIHVLTTHGFD